VFESAVSRGICFVHLVFLMMALKQQHGNMVCVGQKLPQMKA